MPTIVAAAEVAPRWVYRALTANLHGYEDLVDGRHIDPGLERDLFAREAAGCRLQGA
jgi:hypothetical protein